MRQIAKALFYEYCDCKEIKEGAFYGINLSASGSGFLGDALAFTGFRNSGGAGEGGVQALVLCGSKSVAFYSYGGLSGGFGSAGGAVMANLGVLDGYGVGTPTGYTKWFTTTNFGGVVGKGWTIGANGGGFHGTNFRGGPVQGGYVNIAGGVSSGPGVSFTAGRQYYWLLGVVPAQ